MQRGTREHLEQSKAKGKEGKVYDGCKDDYQAWRTGASQGGHLERKRPQSREAGPGPETSEGGFFYLLLVLPPLVPPGLLIVYFWAVLTDKHLETLPKLFLCGIAVGALGYLCRLFYRHIPRFLTSLVTALYMAVTYGAAMVLGKADQNWIIGVTIGAAIFGYSYGARLSRRHRY